MPSDKSEEQFQAEQDVRTMIEADRVKADKKRLSRAVKEAKAQMKALEGFNG